MKAKDLVIVVSDFGKLIPEDLKSIWKGALIATASALLTYATAYITGRNFGEWTPLVVAVWGIIVNTIKKALEQTAYIK